MSSQLNDSATIRAIGVDPPRRTESKRLGRALNLAEGGKKNRRKLEAKRRIEEVKDESQAHCNKRKVKSSAVVTTLLRHRGPGGVQGGGGGAPLMMRRGSNRRRRFLPAEAADRSANGRRQIDVLRSGARFASAEEPAVGDVRLIVPPPSAWRRGAVFAGPLLYSPTPPGRISDLAAATMQIGVVPTVFHRQMADRRTDSQDEPTATHRPPLSNPLAVEQEEEELQLGKCNQPASNPHRIRKRLRLLARPVAAQGLGAPLVQI